MEFPTRKSIRLKKYDYSLGGAYFVTICVQDYICRFGSLKKSKVILNNVGNMIKKWWFELPNKFDKIENDVFIVMPNHIHGIILMFDSDISIVGADLCVCPDNNILGEHIGSPLQNNNRSLSKIIQWFKTMTTNEYIRNVKEYNWEKFEKRLWQRNYYEHIIRNQKSFNKIGEYIYNNPAKWKHDELFITNL